MDAEELAAGRAGPLRPLGSDEAADSDGLNGRQIVDHAHPVIRPIAPIHILQPGAREDRAIETEPAGPLFAKVDPAMAAAETASRPAAVAGVFSPITGEAERAIHPAGGDRF